MECTQIKESFYRTDKSMDKNNRLKELKDIIEVKKERQLTLQEKWQIDAELAKERNKNNRSEVDTPIIGKQVSKKEFENILKENNKIINNNNKRHRNITIVSIILIFSIVIILQILL